jgi:uncharacterized membrane protein
VQGEVDTGRIEAFSDGVFAITLLILEVGVKAHCGSLAYRLTEKLVEAGYLSRGGSRRDCSRL